MLCELDALLFYFSAHRCQSARQSPLFFARDLFRWWQNSGQWIWTLVDPVFFSFSFSFRFGLSSVIFVQWAKLQITARKPLPLSSLTGWNVRVRRRPPNFYLQIFRLWFLCFCSKLLQISPHHVFDVGFSSRMHSVVVTSPASIKCKCKVASHSVAHSGYGKECGVPVQRHTSVCDAVATSRNGSPWILNEICILETMYISTCDRGIKIVFRRTLGLCGV